MAVAACAAVAGCGSLDGMSRGITDRITPYKVEVVQGNFVSREQVEALKPGLSRQQVRDVLGTPLVTSVFHADRWDYVFTLKRQGVEPQSRRLSVIFKGDALERVVGDTMPSETEFISQLESRRGNAKVPVLEASEETLQRASSRSAVKPAAGPVAEPPPAPANYPPLESAGR
jgi:outer membrane protein assembly factor BamE